MLHCLRCGASLKNGTMENLESLDLVPLEKEKLRDINGGFLAPIAAAFGVIGAVAFALGYAYEKIK